MLKDDEVRILYCSNKGDRMVAAAVGELRNGATKVHVTVCAHEEHDSGELAIECLNRGARDFFTAGMPASLAKARLSAAATGQPPYSRLRRGVRPGAKIFVSTPYHAEADKDIRAIEMAIRHSGLRSLLSRKELGFCDLTAKISREIRECGLLIANCTVYSQAGPNANVYHEVGYGRGKGVRVIYLMRTGSAQLPSTLSGQSRLEYHTSGDLAVQLYYALQR